MLRLALKRWLDQGGEAASKENSADSANSA